MSNGSKYNKSKTIINFKFYLKRVQDKVPVTVRVKSMIEEKSERKDSKSHSISLS